MSVESAASAYPSGRLSFVNPADGYYADTTFTKTDNAGNVIRSGNTFRDNTVEGHPR